MSKIATSLIALTFSIVTLNTWSQSISVGPYLQDAHPNAMTMMWETNSIDESIIEWGATNSLGSTSIGTFVTGSGLSRVHTVVLENLNPDTRYFYRISTDDVQSAIFDFITPPLPESEKNFNLISMSDMQQDGSHPEVFSDIINNELIPFVNDRFGNDLATDIAYVFIPGDLVSVGGNYPSWKSTFFDPAQAIFQHVPVYPVAGNHEQNSANYFRYFNLPENGTNQSDYLEHWYYKDYSNVRLIGLESNNGYRIQEQLDWLQSVLNDACADEHIDFVFAQLHHPHHSELWIDGNTDYTGDVIEKLEIFSSGCGKPSVHFFGHTHGYSRGQSRDHQHLMVNVASAGGAIDNWGEYAQQDYKEYSKSTDDYGFVLVEVEAGENPQFLLSRVSHGSFENGLVNAEIRDTIRVMKNNIAPDQPIGLFPIEGVSLRPDCITFLGSDFNDTNGGDQGAVHWQIATDPSFFSLVYDDWFQHENWYFDEDLEADNSMTEREVTMLNENTNYYWRVRYRDRNLSWSDWSGGISFQTTESTLSENLLLNAGAEEGTSNWTSVSGSFEAISSGECAGNNAYAGSYLFAVGGVCNPMAYGEAYQEVSIEAYGVSIDNDSAYVNFGGYLSDYSGDDLPEFKLEFYNQTGGLISFTTNYPNQSPEWTYLQDILPIPSGARAIRMVLMGTRNAGSDNDSYFDNMFLRVQTSIEDCEEQVIGLDALDDSGVLYLYPNPSDGEISIQVPPILDAQEYFVSNALGENVKLGVLKKGIQTIDLSDLNKGVYFLNVPGGALGARFVLQ
ncbi:MAG: fibronectin type III domain-containing protein [Crocinitomicaceae bacterium]|jgi:hypothetical protein|tara:strand:+ start:33536 stop:35899 length:2364 start_codon:yes stop_codon:yes gene_type:complete